MYHVLPVSTPVAVPDLAEFNICGLFAYVAA